MGTRPLRVCYFGTYRAEYGRNSMMIAGLRRAGLEVVECHEPLWHSIEDRVQTASGGWTRPSFWWRVVRAYGRLIWRFTRIGPYDVLVIGYPGQADVYLARLLSWLGHRPLVWDVFMSIYLIALERGLGHRSAATVRLLRWLERVACRLSDLLILDTADYVSWFATTHGVQAQRFRLVPTGADDRVFVAPSELGHGPRDRSAEPAEPPAFRVLYYGTFIPNHGVRHIVEAARLLADEPTIRFELIGDGPDRATAIDLARRYRLANVTFVGWLPQAELVSRAAAADICLGAFGTTPQSLMTVHNKVYEGLAMRKPVITGDSPAVRAALTHGEHIYLCRRADPRSLADAILALQMDGELRERLSREGHRLFVEQLDLEHNGRRFAAVLSEVAG